MNFIRIVFTTTAVVYFACIPAIGKELATTGRTYPIAERDALEEVEERARSVDWQKHLKAIKPGNYRPENLTKLPRAHKNNKFLVDMTYMLENDIVNDKGELLYPKGYRFNPLDFVSYNKTLVVINGEDPDQVQWFQSSSLTERMDVSLYITQGSSTDLSRKIKRPVFYATNPFVGRFQLKAVPSIVKVKGREMEVEELAVKRRIR
ncbi:hypothetical protein EG832_11810 [bacterium]|nr:hypothetical protein [bacterium]